MHFLLTLLTGMSVLILSPASYGNEVSTLVLGTATSGGGFALYGEAVAAAVHETDPSLRIDLRATKGSAENVPRRIFQGNRPAAVIHPTYDRRCRIE